MIVDMLIAEIAAERGENPKELKDRLVRKIEEERRVGAVGSQPITKHASTTRAITNE